MARPEVRQRRRLATVLVATALAPTFAEAHARLVRSEPGARQSVPTSPKVVRLWFSERIEPRFAKVGIQDEGGGTVPCSAPATSADDAKLLELRPDGPLRPGRYRLHYRVLSVDGHVIEASYTFTVTGP